MDRRDETLLAQPHLSAHTRPDAFEPEHSKK
jgi:hypothetical protein